MKLTNLFLKTSKNNFRLFLALAGMLSSYVTVAQAAKIKSQAKYSLALVFIGKQKNSLAKDKATLVFDTKKQTAKCYTSCNFIELHYKSKKHAFTFNSIVPGTDPCPDHLIGLESDLKENLKKINSILVQNNKIFFFDKKDTLLIFYEQ